MDKHELRQAIEAVHDLLCEREQSEVRRLGQIKELMDENIDLKKHLAACAGHVSDVLEIFGTEGKRTAELGRRGVLKEWQLCIEAYNMTHRLHAAANDALKFRHRPDGQGEEEFHRLFQATFGEP